MTREEYVEKVVEPTNAYIVTYFALLDLDEPNHGCLVGDLRLFTIEG